MDLTALLNAAANQAAAIAAPPAAATTPTIVGFDGEALDASPDFIVPVAPAVYSLFPHQRAAVETILTHRRVVLGHQPGMGKTLTMATVAAAVAAEGGRSIVICPPTLIHSVWVREIRSQFPALKVEAVEGRTPRPVAADTDVVVVGYAVLKHRQADLIGFGARALLLDEAHKVKHVKSAQSKATYAIASSLPADAIVVAATGTIVDNHLADAWHPIRVTGDRNLRAVSGGVSFQAFANRHCHVSHNGYGLVVRGALDMEATRRTLVSTCMVSVDRDVALSLPERTTSLLPVAVPRADRASYDRAADDPFAFVRSTKGNAAAARMSKAEAIAVLNLLRRMSGVATAKTTAGYVADLVEQGEQVVVMAEHVEVIDTIVTELAAQGIAAGVINGSTGKAAKVRLVDEFQSKVLPVIVCNFVSGGVGLTLHAAANIVFAELPWTPGGFEQCASRIYRAGQTRRCVTHVLVMEDSIASIMWDSLSAKTIVADAVNTGRTGVTIPLDSVRDEVLAAFGWHSDYE